MYLYSDSYYYSCLLGIRLIRFTSLVSLFDLFDNIINNITVKMGNCTTCDDPNQYEFRNELKPSKKASENQENLSVKPK